MWTWPSTPELGGTTWRWGPQLWWPQRMVWGHTQGVLEQRGKQSLCRNKPEHDVQLHMLRSTSTQVQSNIYFDVENFSKPRSTCPCTTPQPPTSEKWSHFNGHWSHAWKRQPSSHMFPLLAAWPLCSQMPLSLWHLINDHGRETGAPSRVPCTGGCQPSTPNGKWWWRSGENVRFCDMQQVKCEMCALTACT